jgi:hypothetical protein
MPTASVDGRRVNKATLEGQQKAVDEDLDKLSENEAMEPP